MSSEPTPSPPPPAVARGPSGRFLPRASPPLAPERERLAAAITRHRAALANHANTSAALARAEPRRWTAATARSEAEGALALARADEGRWLAEKLLTDAEPGPSPVKTAEAALTAATEEHAALVAAVEALRGRLGEVERELANARHARRERAVALLATAPAVLAAVDHLEAVMRELVEAGDIFVWLTNVGALVPVGGYSFDASRGDLPTRVRLAAGRLQMPPTSWTDLLAEAAGSRRVFADALEALESDAEAPLP